MSSIWKSLISLVLIRREGVEQFSHRLDQEEAHGGVEHTVEHLAVQFVGTAGSSIEHQACADHLDGKECEGEASVSPDIYLGALGADTVLSFIIIEVVPIGGPAGNHTSLKSQKV